MSSGSVPEDAISQQVISPGVQEPLRIVIGSDSAGHEYKTALKAELEKNPAVSEVLDVGVGDAHDSTAYPHVAVDACKKITARDVQSVSSFVPVGTTLT